MPFAGDDQPRTPAAPVKVHRIQHRVDTHAQHTAEKRGGPCAEAAGGPAAGQRQHLHPQIPGQHLRQMAQPRVQPGHHGRVRPLLRAEHRRRARRAAQWVVDVAHHRYRYAAQRPAQRLRPDTGDACERAAHRHEGAPLFIEKFRPQRCGGAAAAIVGGAAAQPQHQPHRAVGQRMGHQLPHAVGGRLFRVAGVPRQRQARRRSHLHHRRAVRQQGVVRRYRLSPRAGTGRFDAPSAHGGQKGVHRTLSAIGHRNGADLRRRLQPQDLLRRDAADIR